MHPRVPNGCCRVERSLVASMHPKELSRCRTCCDYLHCHDRPLPCLHLLLCLLPSLVATFVCVASPPLNILLRWFSSPLFSTFSLDRFPAIYLCNLEHQLPALPAPNPNPIQSSGANISAVGSGHSHKNALLRADLSRARGRLG